MARDPGVTGEQASAALPSDASARANQRLLAHLEAGGKLWLLSDLHANLAAARACLHGIGSDDALIIMGDLLTYGCHPMQTLELVERCLEEHTAALLLGNHDALYRELERGGSGYYDTLPDWIRESVDWTAKQLDLKWFSQGLPWQQEIGLGDVLVTHANPYGPGDWRYLDAREQYSQALDTLVARGFRLGIFGHVHRPRLLARHAAGDCAASAEEHWDVAPLDVFELPEGSVAAWNVGSLGQQRTTDAVATVGHLRKAGTLLQLAHQRIPYDVAAHLGAIESAGFSAATCARLLGFHRAPQP